MMTLNVVRKTLGLSLVAGLLLTVSWVGNAQGIEWGRRSNVTYSSGYVSSGGNVEGAVVSDNGVSGATGDCESCGTAQGGCRRGCCANSWDGYCEERRWACGSTGCRGCCMNSWDGYCEERRGCNWGGCKTRGCKTSCCAPACNSCGDDGGADVTTATDGVSTPADPSAPTTQPKASTTQPPTLQLKPTTPEPPKPGLDRSATLRRVR